MTEPVVLSLFGRAASTPQYAIHEEDELEWLHALLSDSASLPEWLTYPLKHHPMLFIGCEIPDWLGRFLLRMSSNSRLSLERNQQFFFVGNSTSREASLSNFFATYCRKTLVQQLDMEPAAFVAQLRARWEQQNANRSRAGLGNVGSSAGIGAESRSAADKSTIFISYMREDADAARRLYDAITALGGDVWLDERRISPGDAWEPESPVPNSANCSAVRSGHLREYRDRGRGLCLPRMGRGDRAIALDHGPTLHRAGGHRRRLRR